MGPKRGKITRAGKQFVLPVRSSDAEVARDRELLNSLSRNLSEAEAENAVAQIKKQREEELQRSLVDETDVKRGVVDETDVKGAKRARIYRNGKNCYLPVRTSHEDRARDQELLDAIGKDICVEEVEKV